jgi:hypothetical protein
MKQGKETEIRKIRIKEENVKGKNCMQSAKKL